MAKKKIKFAEIGISILVIIIFLSVALFISSFIVSFIYVGIDQYKRAKFCQDTLKSDVEVSFPGISVWSSWDYKTEIGYVECCRAISVNHKIKDDCHIFEYERG